MRCGHIRIAPTRCGTAALQKQHTCRLPVPGEKVVETFDQAFRDKATAMKFRSDPLIVLDPPRLGLGASYLSNEPQRYKAATALQTPFLVCSAWPGVVLSGTLSRLPECAVCAADCIADSSLVAANWRRRW